MGKKKDSGQIRLEILNQSRDREIMPRPAVFRDKTKYDRNAAKDAARREQNTES